MAHAVIEHEPLKERLQYVNHHSFALGSFDAVAINEIDTSVHAHAYVATLPCKQKPKISAEIAEMRWLALHEAFFITVALLLKKPHHSDPPRSIKKHFQLEQEYEMTCVTTFERMGRRQGKMEKVAWEKQQGDCAIEDLLMGCPNGVAS